MSLLDKAKEKKKRDGSKKEITPEMVDLTVAWLKGEITTAQVDWAFYGKTHRSRGGYINLALTLREMYKLKLLKLQD